MLILFSAYSCDLAGSERVKKTKAEGERLQEAQSINSSLLELGYVERMQSFQTTLTFEIWSDWAKTQVLLWAW